MPIKNYIIILLISLVLINCKDIPSKKKQYLEKPTKLPGNAAEMKVIHDRGELLFKIKRLQTLIATYEKVLKAAPENAETKKKLAELYYDAGILEIERGDTDTAKNNLKHALELNPEHTEAKKHLDKLQTAP